VVLLYSVLAVIVLVACYALVLLYVHRIHDIKAFPGCGLRVDPSTPGHGSLEFEDLYLPLSDGTSVHAWWIPARSGRDDADTPTLVYFHGNGHPLESQADVEAPALHESGMNLLLVDYRGFGLSSPMQTTAASTHADACAALDHLVDKRGIAPSRIWIGGRSIGSAVAVRLAAENPGCAGLILVTPITNTVDVGSVSTFIRPLKWLGLAKNFDSLTRISTLRIPVLLLAGTEDTVATPAMARRMYARAGGAKRIEVFDGVMHGNLWDVARSRAIAAIREIL
jgi:pimeloyl-ACP methyl ester carboxylesterase